MERLLAVLFLFLAGVAVPGRAFREGYRFAELDRITAHDANDNANADNSDNNNENTRTAAKGNSKLHTMLKFKVPADATLPKVQLRSTSQLQEADVAETATKGFPEELAYFEKYDGVKGQWLNTLKTMKPSSDSIYILDKVKTWEVPGLKKGTTFDMVFKTVQKKCPLWIVGGAVRDLVVGEKPNDIDCIALCETSVIAKVAKEMGWKHKYRPGSAYFAIGDTHTANPNYLEGFSGDLLFESADMAEMTTSILLWGLSTNTIVDPSGKGVSDALNMLLRPAVPDEGKSAKQLWKDRRQWLFGGFSGPRLARHVRYLKMRMRGWKPADECVRTFMANTIAAMSLAERLTSETKPGLVTAFGYYWPFLPHATLEMLVDKFGHDNRLKQAAAVRELVKVYKEDMADYFAGKATGSCGKDWTPPLVVNEKSVDVSFIPHSVKDILKPITNECRLIKADDPSVYSEVKYFCSTADDQMSLLDG